MEGLISQNISAGNVDVELLTPRGAGAVISSFGVDSCSSVGGLREDVEQLHSFGLTLGIYT